MDQLVRKTGESIFLGIVSAMDALCVAVRESPQSIRLYAELGRRAPLHSGGVPKILFAFMPGAQLPDALQVGAAASLRGYKDTRVPLLLVVIAYWVISLPLGYSLALTNLWGAPMGARGFWISLIIGLSVAALLLGSRLLRVERRRQ
jgi:Na+-driven multidrug efflux pump